MGLDRPLEGLLRPPLEWYSTAMAGLGSVLLMTQAPHFLLPSALAHWTAGGLALFSGWRFRQGYAVYRYQRQLKRLPRYALSSRELSISKKYVFLGKGFLWTAKHTQRLRDLDLDYHLVYRYPSRWYRWARQWEFRYENKPLLNHLTRFTRHDSPFNPVRPYPDIGGEPCIHGVGMQEEQDVTLSLIERAGHTLVLGTTGVGKTRLAELLIAQDIRRGDVVIVLDPKGDADLLKRIFIEAQCAGRTDDVLVFHLGFPLTSARYNPIGYFTKITQVATRVANALPSTGEAASFKEFAWKYVNLVTRGLIALGEKPDYKKLNFYMTRMNELVLRVTEHIFSQEDAGYENWLNNHIFMETRYTKEGDVARVPTREQAMKAYLDDYLLSAKRENTISSHHDLLIDLAAANRLDKTHYDKITASVSPLLEKLTSGAIAGLLSPDYNDINDERPIFDWLQVIRQKKIVYVGMDALTDTIISSTVGNAMLSDLVSVAGHLYKFGVLHGFEQFDHPKIPLPRICLHSDEFNEVIGDEFIPILNKARGAGFNVVAYTQTWSDVEARLQSTAKAGQVAGNLNNILLFRTKEAKTVEMVLSQLPEVPIIRAIPASSSSDTPHGEHGVFYQSSNEDRFTQNNMRLIEQSDVLNLPKGQAFCVLEGGKLYKIRVPLPADDHSALPDNVDALIQHMRSRQQTISFHEEQVNER